MKKCHFRVGKIIILFMLLLVALPNVVLARGWYPATDQKGEILAATDDFKLPHIIIGNEKHKAYVGFVKESDVYMVALKIFNNSDEKITFTKRSVFIRDNKGGEYGGFDADDVIKLKYGATVNMPVGEAPRGGLGGSIASGIFQGIGEGFRQNFISSVKSWEFPFGEILPHSETKKGYVYFGVNTLSSPVAIIMTIGNDQYKVVFQRETPKK